jgi:hypothetical protein
MTPEEIDLLKNMVVIMSDGEVSLRLEAMAKRELSILDNQGLESDPIREEVIYNVAALAAAAERLSPIILDQTETQETETSGCQHESRVPLTE